MGTLQRTWDGGYVFHNDHGGISVHGPRDYGNQRPSLFSFDNINNALDGQLPTAISTSGDVIAEIEGVSYAIKTFGRFVSGVGIVVDVHQRAIDRDGITPGDVLVVVSGGLMTQIPENGPFS